MQGEAFAKILQKVANNAVQELLFFLPEVHLNKQQLAALYKALENNSSVESLSLLGNRIGDAEATALAMALTSHRTLRFLNLGHNEIGDVGALALAVISVEKLVLRNNKIGDVGAQALAKNPHLQYLDLGINNIGDQGAVAFSDSVPPLPFTPIEAEWPARWSLLKSIFRKIFCKKTRIIGGMERFLRDAPTGLQELFLDHNRIGNGGAIAIASHRRLRYLDLNQNRIRDEGAFALIEMVVRNPFLSLSVLYGNSICNEADARLKEQLDFNERYSSAQRTLFLMGTHPRVGEKFPFPKDIAKHVIAGFLRGGTMYKGRLKDILERDTQRENKEKARITKLSVR